MSMSYHYDTRGLVDSGASRWASEEEICAGLTRLDLTGASVPAAGFPVVSDGRTAYALTNDEHALLLGASGSKKTRLQVMPSLCIAAMAGESVIVNDCKGELYRFSAGMFAKHGYDIKVLNFRDPLHTNTWSPLHEAADLVQQGYPDRAAEIINDLGCAFFPDHNRHIDPFWTQTSRAMFRGLAGMVAEKPDIFGEYTLWTLEALMNSIDEDSQAFSLSDLLEYYPADSVAAKQMRTAMLGSERTRENVQASYAAGVSHIYSSRGIASMLSKPDIDFHQIGRRKTALFIMVPDDKDTYNSLATLVIMHAYRTMIGDAQAMPGGMLPIRVNFFLDEFANMPAIPSFTSMISAARSRNIRFLLVVQSLHQLTMMYGEDAQVIRANCGVWMFLHSRELAMLNEISELVGYNQQGRLLITPSQLQRLDKQRGEMLVIMGREYPYMAHLPDISEYAFRLAPMPDLPTQTLVKPQELDILMLRKAMEAERLASMVKAGPGSSDGEHLFIGRHARV